MGRSALAIMAATIITACAFATTAHAMSVQDFDQLPEQQQAHFVTGFIEKMTADIGANNPSLAQQIRDWFAHDEPGGSVSEGMENLVAQLTALDIKARDGRADLSKIKVEAVIVWVVKQKFPPPAAS
jgi:hypothetical protein